MYGKNNSGMINLKLNTNEICLISEVPHLKMTE